MYCLKKLKKIAKESDCEKYKFAAVIYKGNKFIAGACNIRKTHPRGSGINSTLHAEVRTILKALRTHPSLEGYQMYVLRIGRRGDLRPAKPCKDCMKMIRKYKLRVTWT